MIMVVMLDPITFKTASALYDGNYVYSKLCLREVRI